MIRVALLAVILSVCSAIKSPSCPIPDLCSPRVTAECPNKLPDGPSSAACPTCCCKSSDNIEFYDPEKPEPRCTAPPARFRAKLVGTWSRECNPDYYFNGAHWSPLTGISHDSSYEVWEACMRNVSRGVALVSQTGQVSVIEGEYRARGDAVHSIYRGGGIEGDGETSATFAVDKDHQYVSGLTMLAPSLDRVMGVSRIRLCDGSDWKRNLKYCGELFSTATKSERVAPRNSIQFSNCSFGYFELTFLDYLEPPQQPFPPPESPACQQLPRRICPSDTPSGCGLCCCQSRNEDFYSPDGQNPECTAPGEALYRVVLRSRLSQQCTPDFFPSGGSGVEFSPLVAVSHDPSKEIWNRCLYNVSEEVSQFARLGESSQGLVALARVLSTDDDTFYDARFRRLNSRQPFLNGRKTKSVNIRVDANHSYVSVLSKLVPSFDQFVGVSRLQLCDGDSWKETVDVCLELFSAGSGSVQKSNCSLATLHLRRKLPSPKEELQPTDFAQEENCSPVRASVLNQTICCKQEFVVEGRIVQVKKEPKAGLSLLVQVEKVHYDEIGLIKAKDTVEVKLCGLPNGLNKINRNRSYLLMGERECRTNLLVIGRRGCLERNFKLEGSECAEVIKSGMCDTVPF